MRQFDPPIRSVDLWRHNEGLQEYLYIVQWLNFHRITLRFEVCVHEVGPLFLRMNCIYPGFFSQPHSAIDRDQKIRHVYKLAEMVLSTRRPKEPPFDPHLRINFVDCETSFQVIY